MGSHGFGDEFEGSLLLFLERVFTSSLEGIAAAGFDPNSPLGLWVEKRLGPEYPNEKHDIVTTSIRTLSAKRNWLQIQLSTTTERSHATDRHRDVDTSSFRGCLMPYGCTPASRASGVGRRRVK